MSNTGHKGVSYLPDQGVYKVTVGWRGRVHTRYLRGSHPKDLKKAIQLRNQIEHKVGRPRTEDIVRSSGTVVGRAWKRRGKKIVRTRGKRS
ncbi:MAG TPA: hypothetical protein VLL77_11110 [Anaerolineales bacterium]|nr:hypothetical protein [Anaerolineales bacterium]